MFLPSVDHHLPHVVFKVTSGWEITQGRFYEPGLKVVCISLWLRSFVSDISAKGWNVIQRFAQIHKPWESGFDSFAHRALVCQASMRALLLGRLCWTISRSYFSFPSFLLFLTPRTSVYSYSLLTLSQKLSWDLFCSHFLFPFHLLTCLSPHEP